MNVLKHHGAIRASPQFATEVYFFYHGVFGKALCQEKHPGSCHCAPPEPVRLKNLEITFISL